MATKTYKRNVFQRIAGKPQTQPPIPTRRAGPIMTVKHIDLTRARELTEPWGAINIDDPNLPVPVMVFLDDRGVYRAYCNLCGHGGRRLDPVPGTRR
ncbi:MAG: hypothetical protein R3C44_22350 [Chloroflexota bacterium]